VRSIFNFDDMAINSNEPRKEPITVELDLPMLIPLGSRIKRQGDVFVVYSYDFEMVGPDLAVTYKAHLHPSR